MNMRAIAGLSLSALMLGGTMVGCGQSGIASASSRSTAANTKQAAANAAKASKLLAKGDAAKAIGFAEAAVALMPQDAGYRSLLGAAYLKAGRFTSAHATYADVLTLSPDNGKAALNMALAMIAEGQWDQARGLLDQHAAIVPASDRGLALALAGDPAAGIEVLTAATRSPDADVKTRQNLALAMALGGRWQEARSLVGVDMAPIEADARIMQWAAFAKPTGAADQVAALLGVVPVKDPGQPVALALNAAVPVAAVAPVALAESTAPIDMPSVEEAPAYAAAPSEVPVAVGVDVGGAGKVTFAARQEVVQVVPSQPAPVIAAKGAFRTKLAAVSTASVMPVAGAGSHAPAKGNWFVQLGAYDSAGVAKDAWGRATRRYTPLAAHTPAGVAFKTGGTQFYRLSVGGFARADADALCRGYRAKGGACFVRAGAGDKVASWAAPARVQLASR